MYKDVKKKLLSVVLCVCMVIGVVEVVPKVKAAVALNTNNYYPIQVGYTGEEGSSLTVYVQLESETTYTYADKNYIPEIKKVVTDMNNPGGSDITDCFNKVLKIVDGSNINAGKFYGVLWPQSTYSVTYDNQNNHENEIEFTINPAKIDYITASTGSTSNPVLTYASGGVSPQLNSVTVSCESTDIVYRGSDIDEYCSISKIDEIGKGKKSVVTLNENKNFSNWHDVSADVYCDVAFDLGDSNYAVLNQASLTYTGDDLSSQVTMDVYGKDHSLVYSGANKNNNLKFVFKKGTNSSEQLIEPGTYEVSVTPAGGVNKTVTLGNELYTGTCIGTIEVGLRTPSTIEITADDENGNTVTLKGDNSYLYRISLNEKNVAGEVLPRNMKVKVNGSPLDERQYSVTFEDQYGNTNEESGAPVKPTKAGQYKMTVTLDPLTTYNGKLTVMYYVYTNLCIETIQFKDVNKKNPTNLPFLESGYEVETDNQKLIVKDNSGNTLTLGRHFEIKYRYAVKNGNSVDWETATGFDGAGMNSVGKKRIYFEGIKAYYGESVYWEYTIDPVNITEANGFKLELNGGSGFDYTGEEIKPAYTFTYNGNPVNTEYYKDGYSANKDAGNGKATLTVTAKDDAPYLGSMSVTFNINALKLSDARCTGDGFSEYVEKYSYTGDPITPEFHIGDYNLEIGRDYVIDKYRNVTTGTEFTDAPTVPGKYIVCIKEGTNSQNVRGTGEIPYEIIRRDISKAVNVSFANGNSVEWDGGETQPEVVCGFGSKKMTTDEFGVTYKNNKEPSSDTVSASAIVTGQGYFTGSKEIYFEITKRKISNANIVVTSEVTNSVPPYNVSFSIRDNGINVKEHDLVAGADNDYEITKILYKSGSDYVPNVGDLSALQRAGEYEVTIAGRGNYTDTVTAAAICGTNLADLEVKLDKGTFRYNGQEQYPKITVYKGAERLYFNKGDNKANTYFYPIFSRDRDSDVPDGYENIYAGTVYVKIVGNTQKGFYGEKECGSYSIGQMDISDKNTRYEVDLSEDPDRATIDAKGRVHYTFTNSPIKPQVKVKKSTNNSAVSASAILTEKLPDSDYGDYTVSYEDDHTSKGMHTVYVNGTGNFTGQIECDFVIDGMSIADERIKAIFSNVDTYAEGEPTLTLKLNSTPLIENEDYTLNIRREKSASADWEDTYVYEITGMKNYIDSYREERQQVSKTPLILAEDFNNPQPGEVYISSWDYSELTVSPGAVTLETPSSFILTYKKKDGRIRNLSSADFRVTQFVPSMKPGIESTTMTITGIGGFTGNKEITVPLFTDINDAKFLTDENGRYASTLSPGGSISIQKLQDAIDLNQLAELVWFKNIWPEETGGRIDPSCYSVTASKEPALGKLTLTVAGNEEKFYTGSRSFDVIVTGELQQEITKVEIGDDNVVAWKGLAVTPGAVKVQVYNEGQLLTGGYLDVGVPIPSDWDYTVSFSGNNGVGLATATINGVNSYSGKVTQPFKITCLMNDLTVQIQDKDGVWITYNNGDTPEYPFKTDTEKNKPAIKLYYSMVDGALNELEEKYFSAVYNNYTEAAGASNISISEPQEEKYQGILLGSGRSVKYFLTPISMEDVSIELENRYPVYTGNEMTATDIGLTLKYGSYPLQDTDYSLKFRYAINTDEVDGRQAEVIITGNGNFSGSVTKYFSITPLPIGSETFIAHNVPQPLTYTGQEQVPEFTVSQVQGNVRTLKEGTDYKIVKYLDDSKTILRDTPFSDVGTYYVRIEGLGNYHNTQAPYREIEYKIQERQISDNVVVAFVNSEQCPVINGVPQCVYNGKEHRPEIKVMYNNKELNGPDTVNAEYTVEYGNNKNATKAGSKATVTISGIGSFSGTRTLEFVIQPKSITGTDISYRDNDGNLFKDEQTYEWTKSPVKPVISVYDGTINEMLIQGASDDENAHYSVDYDDTNGDKNTQCNAGKVTMKITGQGNYTGTKVFTYYIGEDISKSYTLINGKNSASTEYNGLVQAPDVKNISVVWKAEADLVDANNEKRYDIAYFNEDFSKTVSPSAIVDAGKYYISVVGVPSKGTYAKSSKENSCVYEITQRSIAPSYILVSGYDGTYYYTGQPIEPTGIVVEDADLPVDENKTQKRTVQLRSGIDYTLSYENQTQAGKASIKVNGKGNYTGTRVAYFTIVSSDTTGNNTGDGTSEGTGSIDTGTTTIKASDIRLGFDNSSYNCMMYNGYERIPTVTINGVSTNEFNITASNNINPGVATLVITGRGNNYTGTIIKNYIIKADLSVYGNVVSIADQVYTGYQITPHVMLTCAGNLLNQGTDYTVTYLNNTNVGRATVTARANSNSYYIGTATGGFNISNKATGMEITGYASSYTYTGYAITPDVVVTMDGRVLNRGTDYVVSYRNNTNVGTATMTVTGIGSFSGTKTINYMIEAKNIENCLTTAVNSYQYTGSTYTPNVTVTDSSTGKTLVAGTDYTITYSNNTNPGTASITVTALSRNYTGSKVIPFKITSAAVSGLRTGTIKNNSIKLAWSDQEYADGYQICNSSNRVIASTSKNSYTVKGLTSCTTYKFKVRSYVENADGSVSYGNFSTAVSAKTLLNTPKLKAKSTSKGKVTLTWTNVSKATGYEIYYSTKKDGIYTRLKTISKSSGRKYVDKGLASGEKYYYTIRAYRTANGVKTYSNYNTIKSVKVK